MIADGRKKQRYVKKEDVVDAYEQRDVAILDVEGAFLLSKIVEFVLVKN